MRSKDIVLCGMMTALALVLSYLESLVPFFFGIPGMKLGLANLCFVFFLKSKRPGLGFIVNISRILLVGFLFGNTVSLIYSIAGGVLAMVLMIVFDHLDYFSIMGISIIGGVFHNIGQLIVSSVIVSEIKLWYYAPVLLVSGAITGLFIGYIIIEVDKRIGGRFI